MMNLHISAVCASILLAVACRAPSAQLVPLPAQDVVVTSPDVARIYFVREEATGLRRAELRVVDGEVEIGLLTHNTYLCWERPGGRRLAQAHYQAVDKTLGKIEGLFDLDCAAGTATYYNVTVRRDDGKPMIEKIDPKLGREYVAKRKWAGEP